jgi:hypothetical protein
MKQIRTSVPYHSNPLAEVGPLPRDLLAAFNSAVLLARNAQAICNLVGLSSTSPDDARMVAQAEQEASDGWDDYRAAILAITNELNELRSSPACFKGIQAANAHLAALDFSVKLSEAIKMALTLAEARRGENCRMAQVTAEAIIEHYDAVRKYLRGEIPSWPNGEEIIAEVQWEAGAAAGRRRTADRSAWGGAEGFSSVNMQAQAGKAGKQQRKRKKRGRPISEDRERNIKLFEDWKAAWRTTRITKAEFVHERGLPPSAVARIERGRKALARRSGQNKSGRK